MGVFSPAGKSPPSSVSITGKSTPNIRSVTLGLSGVESSITFAAAVVAFRIISRSGTLRVATSSGGTAAETTRMDFTPGNCFQEDNVSDTAAQTFYVSTNKDNSIIQILEWT